MAPLGIADGTVPISVSDGARFGNGGVNISSYVYIWLPIKKVLTGLKVKGNIRTAYKIEHIFIEIESFDIFGQSYNSYLDIVDFWSSVSSLSI